MSTTHLQTELRKITSQIDELSLNDFGEERTDMTKSEYKKLGDLLSMLEAVRDKIEVEKRKEKYQRWVNEPTSKPVTRYEPVERSGDGWRSLGEMLQSVVRAGMPSGAGRTDPRLQLAEERAISGLGETVPSDGGFLIGTDYSQSLIESLYSTGLVYPRCRKVTISRDSNSIKIPGIDESSRADGSRQGGIRVYNIEEAGEKTKSKPKFREVSLVLSKKCGLCYASDEIIADSSILESYIRNGFSKEMAFKLDDEVINGTGAGGQFLGLMNAPALVTIPKEVGQPAGTIKYENILKMFARFNGNINNAMFLANRDTIPQLYTMSLAIGTGGAPIFLPSDTTLNRRASLFGVPLVYCEQCQTVGTSGDLILFDPSTYLVAEKGPLQVQQSIHVRFIYDESVFRFVFRCDGQPEYSSAVTPFKGSDTQSPYICIESR